MRQTPHSAHKYKLLAAISRTLFLLIHLWHSNHKTVENPRYLSHYRIQFGTTIEILI
jgi:hypothetical protein